MSQLSGRQKVWDVMMLPFVPFVMIWMLLSRRR